VSVSPNSKYFIGKTLPDREHAGKIKNYFSEFLQTEKNAARLGSRNKQVLAAQLI
jgi:hypothetical protein